METEGGMCSGTEAPQIRVFPFEDGWTVGFSSTGYYSQPLTREEAIIKAIQQASEAGVSQIAVVDKDGQIEEWLEVSGEARRSEGGTFVAT